MTDFSERPTWADIDLRALCHNLEQARRYCSAGQRIMAVVKADAYGHGAIPVSRALQSAGVGDFAVATLEEAVALRRSGMTAPLLVLGGCFPRQETAFIEWRLMPALLDIDTARRLNSEALRHGTKIEVHLKVDSGMGRVGFRQDELREVLPQLRQLAGLEYAGLMSHLACADELEPTVTDQQLSCFRSMLAMLREGGLEPRDIHLSNSAGLVGWECPECTMARPGIMLYGGLPGPDFAERLDLLPVMNLRSCIAQLRFLPKGSGISYGHSYHAENDLKIAVLPIGYADGFNRLLSNRAEGLLHGVLVPLVGRVCMDWIMLDVTAVEDVSVGDCVTLLGSADGLTISGDDWAGLLGTISYEVFCRIGGRVPRRYSEI